MPHLSDNLHIDMTAWQAEVARVLAPIEGWTQSRRDALGADLARIPQDDWIEVRANDGPSLSISIAWSEPFLSTLRKHGLSPVAH